MAAMGDEAKFYAEEVNPFLNHHTGGMEQIYLSFDARHDHVIFLWAPIDHLVSFSLPVRWKTWSLFFFAALNLPLFRININSGKILAQFQTVESKE